MTPPADAGPVRPSGDVRHVVRWLQQVASAGEQVSSTALCLYGDARTAGLLFAVLFQLCILRESGLQSFGAYNGENVFVQRCFDV